MSTRAIYILSFLCICGLMLTGIYLQFYQHIEPCPLCSVQRIAFTCLGLVFLLGIIFANFKLLRVIIHFCSLLLSIGGAIFAGRQMWLQHFPLTNGESCGATLSYLLKILPLDQALKTIFMGTAECSEINWQFLYLNIAEWSFLWFTVFIGLSIYLLIKRR